MRSLSNVSFNQLIAEYCKHPSQRKGIFDNLFSVNDKKTVYRVIKALPHYHVQGLRNFQSFYSLQPSSLALVCTLLQYEFWTVFFDFSPYIRLDFSDRNIANICWKLHSLGVVSISLQHKQVRKVRLTDQALDSLLFDESNKKHKKNNVELKKECC